MPVEISWNGTQSATRQHGQSEDETGVDPRSGIRIEAERIVSWFTCWAGTERTD